MPAPRAPAAAKKASGCPFAYLASLGARLDASTHALFHSAPAPLLEPAASSSSSSSGDEDETPLSARLQAGTSEAHTRIERSKGVRAMMGFAAGPDGAAAPLERREYMAWLVGLACVYAAMEAYLPVPATLLAGLQHSDMLPALARLAPLEADLLAHARFLSGGDPSVSAPADEAEVFGLLAHVDAGSASHVALSALMQTVPRSTSFPRDEHLALLSPAHAEAVHTYASRLTELGTAPSSGASTPSSESGSRPTAYAAPLGPGTLVAHAYVRYMGDLSGGQHIAKRARVLWPLGLEAEASTGFESYVFAKPAAWTGSQRAWEGDLKRRFRDAMDGAFARLEDEEKAVVASVLVDEASLAFDLNRGLFDALVPSSEEDDARELAALLAASSPALAKTATMLRSPRALALVSTLPCLAVGLLAVGTGLSSHALSV